MSPTDQAALLDALLAGDAPGLLRIADDMAGRSLSFEAALQELATLLTRIQVAQLAPSAIAEDLPERARLLGGIYSLRSAPGQGTTTVIKLDLPV